MKYTIDAKGKALGRLASEVAALLNGKSLLGSAKNRVADVSVEVNNASQIKVTGKKMQESVHKNYSGFPGGLKETPLVRVVEKHGFKALIEHAVNGMLPKNKLQGERMKNLVIND